MDKIYSVVILCFVLFNNSRAQTYTHELNLGIGAVSRPFAKDGIKFNPKAGAGGHKVNSSEAFHLNYQYSINPRLSVGIIFIYEQLQHEETAGSSDPNNFWMRKIYKDIQYTLLANFRNSWVQKKWISLYSDVALGFNIVDREEVRNDFLDGSTYQKYHFAYQITPIGIKIGKQLFGYAELGYGFKGIVCGGVGIRF